MPATDSEKKEKILIITGEVTFGDQLVVALHKNGYADVTLVKNGKDGLQAIYDKLPHLILLDITLSGIDGYEILAKKQAEPLLAKIPVFLLSTQGVPINMRNVPAGSVSEYIMALQADAANVLEKIDHQFSHPTLSTVSPAVQTGTKKKLLWVEDDKLIGTILAKKLIASNFDLHHAKNGEEALEMLKPMVPNVIVVDLILPGMSGFDILQAVNADPRMKDVPKMVLSNLSKPSDIEKARALGAQKFLVKAATSLDQIVNEVRMMCN